ncbi:hypothetical protein LX32DRAFT_81100 [Colletotrichum zoysiae]|uniref:Uncharacterized protein n=1 Tax=Colletotrichum zoysiae TaxID=1216348 RepID=A0AAD9M0F4_9PEZI|nr:hypothetical protein LX32DRAFT_81100 [Colletotrichum zoysiae]
MPPRLMVPIPVFPTMGQRICHLICFFPTHCLPALVSCRTKFAYPYGSRASVWALHLLSRNLLRIPFTKGVSKREASTNIRLRGPWAGQSV